MPEILCNMVEEEEDQYPIRRKIRMETRTRKGEE